MRKYTRTDNFKGTFSVSGNTITITITHHWNAGDWEEDPMPSVLSGSITKLSDNSFSFSGMGGLDDIYTKL